MIKGSEGDGTSHDRRQEILDAAFHELMARGFAGTTMLAVARRARASKETVYALFGSKEKLFEALVHSRSDRMRAALIPATAGAATDPAGILTRFAIDFLELATDPGTIAVRRLAIAEAERSPELGRILDRAGRAPVRSSLIAYLNLARDAGRLAFDTAEEAATVFMSLILSHLMLPLLENLRPPPTPEAIRRHAGRSVALFMILFGPGQDPGS